MLHRLIRRVRVCAYIARRKSARWRYTALLHTPLLTLQLKTKCTKLH